MLFLGVLSSISVVYWHNSMIQIIRLVSMTVIINGNDEEPLVLFVSESENSQHQNFRV